MTDTKIEFNEKDDFENTINDLDLIQTDVDLNGRRLTNGAKAEDNTDLITKGEVFDMLFQMAPTFRLEDGLLIAVFDDGVDDETESV